MWKKIIKALLLFLIVALLGCSSVSAATSTAASDNVLASAKVVTKGKWIKTKKGTRYRYSDGSYASDVWLKRGKKVYRIGTNGYLKTGWISYNGNSYYANKSGVIYSSKLVTISKKKYYFQADGTCAKDKWVKIGKKYLYFQANGKLAVSQMIITNSKTYYVNKSGYRISSSWITYKGNKYYFDKNGLMAVNQWIKTKGKLYYVNYAGIMQKKRWIGDYYVGSNGVLKHNCTIDGYRIGADGKKIYKKFTGEYIFVGDSRMYWMGKAAPNSRILYLAVSGKGYSWLKNEATQELDYYLKQKPSAKVVLALGVNDLWNVDHYIKYYRDLIQKYPEATFYVLSVNPVDEEKEALYNISRKTADIVAFNQKMNAAFETAYIDAYSYLVNTGFNTGDGLHYTPDTSRVICSYILSQTK